MINLSVIQHRKMLHGSFLIHVVHYFRLDNQIRLVISVLIQKVIKEKIK